MRTRRDQVQAYRFVTRRIVSAMVSGEPETNDLPMRRLGLALVGSVMVGALVLGVFGAYGLLTDNNPKLENDTLVIDKDTGAKYVFTADTLFPVTNYASARLIIGTENPTIRKVSGKSLKDPRGRTVGIVGAPDSLPDPKRLVGNLWRVCSNLTPVNGDRPVSSLVVGKSLSGAGTLGDEAVLTHYEDAAGKPVYFLLWNNTRLAVPSPRLVGLVEDSSIEVSAQLINATPAGPDLNVVDVPRAGSRFSGNVGGAPAVIGNVYQVSDRAYVLTESGLAPVGKLTAKLLTTLGDAEELTTTAQEAERLVTETRVEPAGFPSEMPQLSRAVTPGSNSALCDFYDVGTGKHVIEAYPTRPTDLEQGLEGTDDPAVRTATATVDRVMVAGGSGAMIVYAQPDGKPKPGSTVFLLTDQGRKFPLGRESGSAQDALGYKSAPISPVPGSLIDLIASGPTLEIVTARQAVTNPATTG